MKKLFKVATSAILALLLVANLGLAAFAAEGDDATPTLALTKELQVPAGVTTPEATFTFEFETESDLELPDVTLSFGAEDEANENGSIVKITDDLLEGVTFPHAGEYVYTVTETADTYVAEDNETMTYSLAEYTVRVLVKNADTDGDGDDDELVIDNVIVEKETDDNGQEPEDTDETDGEAVKVDASLPEAGTGEGGEGSGSGSGEGSGEGSGSGEGEGSGNASSADGGNSFRFVNVYAKTTAVDPETNEAKSLEISKTVTGEYGDKTKLFSFELTLKKASTLTDEAQYVYYIADADGEIEDTRASITTGTPVEFQLAHGQKLVLLNAHIGTTYDLTETGVAEYTASATVVENGVSTTEDGTEGTDFTLEDKLIGEEDNSAAVTNAHDADSIIETGITINNLPYIMLVVVAVLGIAVVVVSKKYRAE